MSSVLLVALTVVGVVLGAALAVLGLLALALWVRVVRANRRGLGPCEAAAADTDELPPVQDTPERS